jgi:hypothetical protein
MSTSTAEHDSFLVENWDTETLIDFLKEQNLKLDDDDFAILRKKKITGQDFLDMTEEKFEKCGLEMGPAMRLAKEAKALKDNTKRPFSSYLSLEEVLEKYGIRSNSITSIPQFVPGMLS